MSPSATAGTDEIRPALTVTSLNSLRLPPLKCAEQENCPSAVGELVMMKYQGVDTCTVTLVSADIVLTASHCVPRANLDQQNRFTGNCWVRFAAHNGQLASASQCAELLFATPIEADAHRKIYRDHAFIRLANPLKREPLRIRAAASALVDRKESGLLYGVKKSALAHKIQPLDCRRDDQYPLRTVSLKRDEVLIFPSCAVLHGYSGGPVLDPRSREIIGVISGVIGFDPRQSEKPLPSIGTVVHPQSFAAP